MSSPARRGEVWGWPYRPEECVRCGKETPSWTRTEEGWGGFSDSAVRARSAIVRPGPILVPEPTVDAAVGSFDGVVPKGTSADANSGGNTYETDDGIKVAFMVSSCDGSEFRLWFRGQRARYTLAPHPNYTTGKKGNRGGGLPVPRPRGEGLAGSVLAGLRLRPIVDLDPVAAPPLVGHGFTDVKERSLIA